MTIRVILLSLRRTFQVTAMAASMLLLIPVAAWTQPAGELSRFVTWIETLTLEENDAVIHVAPIVELDGNRGFIIADAREAQIRLHDRTGALVHRFGRSGDGPGEYRGPMGAGRLPSRGIWVVDVTGRVTLYNTTADSVLRTIRTPVMPTYGAALLPDSSLLVIGRTPAEDHLLHILDPRRGEFTRHFFPAPPLSAALGDLGHTAGFADASVRGDTIASVFALADSIFMFTLRGDRIGALPIPARGFRPVPEDQTLPHNPAEFRKFRELFSTLTTIDWLLDGSFLLQYADIVNGEQVITLLHVDRRGRLVFEIRDTPRLLAAEGGRLYFIRPGADLPNQIAIGVLSK